MNITAYILLIIIGGINIATCAGKNNPAGVMLFMLLFGVALFVFGICGLILR